VMAEMTWNVNQPGRWRRPELVAQLRERTPTGALPRQPPARAVGRAQVPRVPPLLAVLVGDPRPVDGAPDRHGALVHRALAPAQRRGQRRRLPVEGRAAATGTRPRSCSTTAPPTTRRRASR
jgi:hypothetical protein